MRQRMERKIALISLALLFIVFLPRVRTRYVTFDIIYTTTLDEIFPFITSAFLQSVPIIYLFVTLAAVYLLGLLIHAVRLRGRAALPQNHPKMYKRLDAISFLVYLMAFYIFINAFWISLANVEGASMQPTFFDGDSLIMRHDNGSLERFDNVVVDPEYAGADFFIKRIIGLPGETLEIEDGDIFIDGERLDQSDFLAPGTHTECEPGFVGAASYCAYELEADEYFIIGDNRNNSLDSRYGIIGPVEKRQIYGTIEYRIFPFQSFGRVN